jgi:hypothetical protein
MKLSANFAIIALASALLTPVMVGATAPALAVVATSVDVPEPACARRIKVVYAGYGVAGCARAEITR